MSSLDDQIRSALDRVSVALRGQLEAELTATRADIVRAAAEAQSEAVTEAVERAVAEAAERSAAEARQAAEAAERSVADARQAAEAAERSVAETRQAAEQERMALQEEFARQRDELERSRIAEVTSRQDALDEIREELDAARRELEERRQEHEAVAEQLAVSRRETEDMRRESEEHLRRIDEHLRLIEETRLRLTETEEGVARAEGERDDVRRELARASRLTRDVRELEAATTLVQVLDALLRLSCQESGRAAVFLTHGSRLKGWRGKGFAPIDLEGLQIDAVEAGLLGQALTSGRQDYRDGRGSALPVFAGGDESRDAVAVPLEVAGSVIAVLYADAPRSDNSEGLPWTDAVDVMARWAGRLLEAITVRDAAALWGPRPISAYRVASSMRSE